MIRNCWLVLYDRKARFLDLHPPPVFPWRMCDVVGKPAVSTLREDCRASFLKVFRHVLKHGVGVIWDGFDLNGIAWRGWMYPMSHQPSVAVGAIVRKWPPAVVRLTPRERQICAAVGGGLHSKEIAKSLGTVTSTINNRRSQIARKLGLHPSALAGWCGLHEEWLS